MLVPHDPDVTLFDVAGALRVTLGHLVVGGGRVNINLLSDLAPAERNVIEEREVDQTVYAKVMSADHVEHIVSDMGDEFGERPKKETLLQAIYRVLLILFDDPDNIVEPGMVSFDVDGMTGTWATPLEGPGPAALRSRSKKKKHSCMIPR